MQHQIRMIAAVGTRTRAIGKDNDLLFKVPEDMKRFQDLTMGHPIIMGRKTWESIPNHRRPLAGRANIVVTNNPAYEALGAVVCPSIEDAIEIAKKAPGSETIYIIGGAAIYELGLPYAEYLDLTEVDDISLNPHDTALVRFPDVRGFTEVKREYHPTASPGFDYVTYRKAA